MNCWCCYSVCGVYGLYVCTFRNCMYGKLKKRDENSSSAKKIIHTIVLFCCGVVALRQKCTQCPSSSVKAFRRLHKNRSLPFHLSKFSFVFIFQWALWHHVWLKTRGRLLVRDLASLIDSSEIARCFFRLPWNWKLSQAL